MSGMFVDTALYTIIYDALLIKWSTLTLQSDVKFDAGDSTYSAGTAADARNNMINIYNWTITDGGEERTYSLSTLHRLAISNRNASNTTRFLSVW